MPLTGEVSTSLLLSFGVKNATQISKAQRLKGAGEEGAEGVGCVALRG